MGFEEQGFTRTGEGNGVVRLEMMGEVMEMPYEAVFHRNAAGTVAAALAAGEDGSDSWMYLSTRTSGGDAITIGGERDSCIEIEGVLLTTVDGGDRDTTLAAHLAGAGELVSDPASLDAKIAEAPQRSANLTVAVMLELMQAAGA